MAGCGLAALSTHPKRLVGAYHHARVTCSGRSGGSAYLARQDTRLSINSAPHAYGHVRKEPSALA